MRRVWLAIAMVLCAALPALSAPEGLAPGNCPGQMQALQEAFSGHMRCGLIRTPLDPAHPAGEQVLVWASVYVPKGATAAPVVLIPGGPGQAVSPMAADASLLLAERFPKRPIVLFDPRGTGRSSRIHCPEFFTQRALSPQEQAERGVSCALRLGERRAFFTARETVSDLERIRAHLGIARWTPLGVSWGTVAAVRYLKEHPAQLERVIVDSTMPAGEPELSDRLGGSALERIIRDSCQRDCPPGSDLLGALTRLAQDTSGAGARVRVPDARGRMQEITITQEVIRDLIYAGDMLGGVREELLAPMAFSWQQGDPIPLTLLSRMLGADGGTPPDRADSTTVHFATACEEGFGMPLDGTPAGLASLAGGTTPVDICRAWPRASAPGMHEGPLPEVPLLILSGSDDLRTPTEGAQELKARAPWARLVVAEGAGHSLITMENECLGEHLTAFMDGSAEPTCRITPESRRMGTAWPRYLREVAPPRGGHRAVRAAAATASYLDLVGGPLVPWQGTGHALRAPGLRAGSVAFDRRSEITRVRGVQVLEGADVSGRLVRASGRLRAAGQDMGVAFAWSGLSRRMLAGAGFATLRWQGREWLVGESADGALGRERLRPVSPRSCQGLRQVSASAELTYAIGRVAMRVLAPGARPDGMAVARLAREGVSVTSTAEGVQITVAADRPFSALIRWPTRRLGRAVAQLELNVCGETSDGMAERQGDLLGFTL